MIQETGHGRFRKSSFSGDSGCVGVALRRSGPVLVRHTRQLDGPVLAFTDQEWTAFLQGVKAGEFDLA